MNNKEYVGVDEKYIPKEEKEIEKNKSGNVRRNRKLIIIILLIYSFFLIGLILFCFSMVKTASDIYQKGVESLNNSM